MTLFNDIEQFEFFIYSPLRPDTKDDITKEINNALAAKPGSSLSVHGIGSLIIFVVKHYLATQSNPDTFSKS